MSDIDDDIDIDIDGTRPPCWCPRGTRYPLAGVHEGPALLASVHEGPATLGWCPRGTRLSRWSTRGIAGCVECCFAGPTL